MINPIATPFVIQLHPKETYTIPTSRLAPAARSMAWMTMPA